MHSGYCNNDDEEFVRLKDENSKPAECIFTLQMRHVNSAAGQPMKRWSLSSELDEHKHRQRSKQRSRAAVEALSFEDEPTTRLSSHSICAWNAHLQNKLSLTLEFSILTFAASAFGIRVTGWDRNYRRLILQRVANDGSDTGKASDVGDDPPAQCIGWWLPSSSTFTTSFGLGKLSSGGKQPRPPWHLEVAGMKQLPEIWKQVSITTASAQQALKVLHSASGRCVKASPLNSFRNSSTDRMVWTLVLAHGWTSAERSTSSWLEMPHTRGNSEGEWQAEPVLSEIVQRCQPHPRLSPGAMDITGMGDFILVFRMLVEKQNIELICSVICHFVWSGRNIPWMGDANQCQLRDSWYTEENNLLA